MSEEKQKVKGQELGMRSGQEERGGDRCTVKGSEMGRMGGGDVGGVNGETVGE